MKKIYFLVCLFVVFSIGVKAQNLILINSQTIGQLTTCLDSVMYTVEVENPSPFYLDSVIVSVDLPEGVEYLSGSLTGGSEVDVSDLNAPQFALDDIETLTFSSFSFYIKSNCEAINTIYSGTPINNVVELNFNSNGYGLTETHESDYYTILAPNLSITNITNQSYSGNVGDVFNRCITIVNGGDGALAELTLEDNHGTGIVITSVDVGSLTNSGNSETIFISGQDFLTVGNGDSLLDPGEQIVICETVEVLSCSDVSSNFSYYWGCGGLDCQNLADAANVIFPGEVPDLVFTPSTDYSNSATNGACYGNNTNGDFGAHLQIHNDGTGTAYGVEIDLFQGWTTSMYSNYYSSLNTNSFTITRNGGTPQPLTFDTTYSSTTKSCLPANPIGRVVFTIDSIGVDDTITIDFNHYTCCYDDACVGNARHHMLGWRFRGEYFNKCNSRYPIVLTQGIYTRYYDQIIVVDQSPGTMIGSSTASVSFINSRFTYSPFPRNTANDLFSYEIILPPCLSMVNGSFNQKNHLGNNLAAPDSIVTSGNIVRVYYSSYVGGTQSTINFDVQLDCNSCGNLGSALIELNSYYSPDLACGCEFKMGCSSSEIELICPTTCEGINLQNAIVERKNYGQVDNDNNGMPDPSGVMDMNLVRKDRLMYGDTLRSFYRSVVNNTSGANWNYVYANTVITDVGNRFAYENATLSIYDASSGTYYTCANIPAATVSSSGTTRTFLNEIDLSSLIGSGCLPSGYTLSTGDSILLEINVSVNSNIGGNVYSGNCTNEIYASTIQNPTNSADKFGCNTIQRSFTLIGYYFTNYGPGAYSTNSCNQYTISQNYYLSIGRCCSNYAGGNLFPYEYRTWTSPSLLQVVMPDSYTFVSAQFNYRRTTGTLSSSVSSWFQLTPTSISGNTYDFDVSNYFGDDQVNDSIFNSDDGYYGTLQIVYEPNCSVADSTGFIRYNWSFDVVDQLLTSTTAPQSNVGTHDEVTYSRPNLFMQANLLSSNTATGAVEWDITVTNNSNNSNAFNVWFGNEYNTGVVADSLFDFTSGTMIYPNSNNLFEADQLLATATKTYKLYSHSTSCVKDSMKFVLGWDCGGYPTSISSYTCPTESLVLSIIPWIPNVTNTIQNLGSDTLQLCDTSEYLISVIDIQLGNLYNVFTSVILPAGMTIVPGSSELRFPSANSYTSIADPTLVSGTTYRWNISALNAQIGANGVSGILDTTSNKYFVKFKCVNSCSYFSGDRLVVRSNGQAACGLNVSSGLDYTNNLFISDALPTYAATIDIQSTYISPCLENSTIVLEFINHGPSLTGATDSIYFNTYSSVNYIPNSFMADLNSPVNTIPNIVTQNGENIYSWKLPENIGVGDTCRFSIEINGLSEDLNCGIQQLKAKISTSGSSTCALTGTQCDIDVLITDTIKNIFIYKSYLDLISSTGSSVVYSPPSGEIADIHINLFNYGETLLQGTNTIFQYYYDADNNGVYSPGDTYITSDTITDSINNNTYYDYNTSIEIPAGNSCAIIAVLDTSLNTCTCIPGQILIPLELSTSVSRLDTMICSAEEIILGGDSVLGYTYTWSPTTNLSDSIMAMTTYTDTVDLMTVDTIQFIREVNRIGCVSYDTTVVITYPNPIAGLALNQFQACQFECVEVVNQSQESTYSPLVDWDWNVSSSNNSYSDTVEAPTICFDEDGTYSIQLTIESMHGCVDSASLNNVLVINPSPVAGFSYLPSDSIKELTEVNFVDESSGADTYWYSFGNDSVAVIPEPTQVYEEEGVYNITQIVENQFGCSDTVTQELIVYVLEYIAIPNIFTPNGDGLNEIFVVRSRHLKSFEARIFNRWGQQVYYWDTPNGGWDGRTVSGLESPEGTYFYSINVITKDGDEEQYQGTLMLKR